MQSLRDLPAGVRQRLEAIDLAGHVYRDEPGGGFVFIDNRIYRVGERIGGPGGPRIEVVVPDGIVVDYGGGRAKIPVAP